ncbi:hypothetical protein [Ostreiculturibacter nitratireducens]|uniref:hypothetical protein n=1 Tax=Ostreiculturibacter nitratireducens TaxID=3075226 RepID=UPI0031B648DF
MPQISHMFFKASAIFLVIGVLIGLQMSITNEHDAAGAHAHLSLLGWVSCALFGGYYAFNPEKAATRIAVLHFWTIVVATALMTGALYLLLLGNGAMVPLVAAGSFLFFAGSLLFLWIVFTRVNETLPRADRPMAG